MDMREQITNTIVTMLENGQAKGNVHLWDNATTLPINYSTKKPYSGINVLLLWIACEERGYKVNEWLTFNQARDLGGQVRKGAKGVMGVYFKMMPAKESAKIAGVEQDGENRMAPMMKAFWLFNIADIDGLPEVTATSQTFDPIERAEDFLKLSGATIQWSGSQAFYHSGRDEIHLPDRERFPRAPDAYAVALHELTHWTGHESRLGRNFNNRFGDDAYAFEELVAELGAAYLVAELGLPGARMENHGTYIASWLKVLRNDKNAIFTASKQANLAYQYIMQLANPCADTGQAEG